VQRITITIDDDLLAQFDSLTRRRGYYSRSEAFRDVLREHLERVRLATVSAPDCVGCLTYVYDHSERDLPRRLVQAEHAHHDVNVATMHLHLDHENCLEATILRGPTEDVMAFAGSVTTQRGVRHGHLWVVPVDLHVDSHGHGGPAISELPHVHSRPKT
jgi:CopG family nickel-responsive transcriptional regulator